MARWDWLKLPEATALAELLRQLNQRLPRLTRALRAPDPTVVVRYGPVVTLDVELGRQHKLTVTDAVAFTIAKPLNLVDGRDFWLDLVNGAGAPLGVITWDPVFLFDVAFVAPGAGKRKTLHWYFDGVSCVPLGPASAAF